MSGLTDALLLATSRKRLFRPAGYLAYASGVTSAVGIAFLTAMYLVHGPFGRLNDICVILQYLLALPLPFALHRLLGGRAPGLSRAGLFFGIGGMLAIIALQILLVAGVMDFGQQVWFISFAMFVVLGVWFAITAYLARSASYPPDSLLMNVLAWSYLGYPLWAFWIGRHLLSDTAAVRSVR